MEPTITPIDATLGAVVTGLDLSRMDALTWKSVEQAFHEHAVLIMRHTRVAGNPATELAPTRRDERASAYEPSSSNR